jgi:hypothetical protein
MISKITAIVAATRGVSVGTSGKPSSFTLRGAPRRWL